eukprot:900443-Pleurochrysis_carterae.AAC.1
MPALPHVRTRRKGRGSTAQCAPPLLTRGGVIKCEAMARAGADRQSAKCAQIRKRGRSSAHGERAKA